MPDLSVIIPCRNAAKYLGCQLAALAAQETSFEWELIVVDNGSTDRSASVANAYSDRMNLQVVFAPDRANSAYARNVGTRASRADKLVFVDADDEVAPGYLEAVRSALQDHDVVTTGIDYEALNPLWSRAAHDVPESAYAVPPSPPPLHGGSLGVARAVLESVGGWPEEYVEAHDLALSYRLQLSGAQPFFIPDPLLRYRHRDSLLGLYRQTREWGRYQVLTHLEFGARILPRRDKRVVLAEWATVAHSLLAARNKTDLARCAVRCGYSIGRLKGSVQFKTLHL